MPKINPVDMRFLDLIFEMTEGYVLDFSNRTFSEFFLAELAVDIDSEPFLRDGSSKARRLRCFLELADTPVSVKALNALWIHRQQLKRRETETILNAEDRFLSLIRKLESGMSNDFSNEPLLTAHQIGMDQTDQLKKELLDIHKLSPQARGYAFETFLQQLLAASGLQPKSPFRNTGEQIDGSFQYRGDTYLIEAKWVATPIGAAELHTHQGKVSEKASWARGVFISYYGFTDVGLTAFGRGKSLICISGKDIKDTLDKQIPFSEVLDRKVRAAAETGLVYVPVSELF